jgi:hypothetical protein
MVKALLAADAPLGLKERQPAARDPDVRSPKTAAALASTPAPPAVDPAFLAPASAPPAVDPASLAPASAPPAVDPASLAPASAPPAVDPASLAPASAPPAVDPASLARAVAAVVPTLPPDHRKSLATVFRAMAEALEA